MKAYSKVAVILIVLGLLIAFGAMAAMNFDFTKLNTVSFVTNTYPVHENFTGISVKGAECDIELRLTTDGTCKVECREGDKIYHTVSVENGILTVSRIDARKWYEHFGVYWGRMEVILYLPQAQYESLSVLSVSGDIEIPADFSFGYADARSTSGDIDFLAPVTNDLFVKTVSGNIRIADTACRSVDAESTSGDIVFSNVLVSGNIHIKSVSGDVDLRGCDAATLRIKTTSGDVSGTLLTEKTFTVNTVSGRVHIPQTAGGGACEIKTTSGDIKMEIG